MPKIEGFYHLAEDGEEAAQFFIEYEYGNDGGNAAYEIVNRTLPRTRPQ